MRLLLTIIFAAIFVWIVDMTTYISLQKPLSQAGSDFLLWTTS